MPTLEHSKTNSKTRALSIAWPKEAIFPKAKKWFVWPHETPSSDLETIVSQAFSHQLTRHCGWDLSNMSVEHLHTFKTAAAIYKRGVSIRSRDVDGITREYNALLPAWTTMDGYEIMFMNEWRQIVAELEVEESMFFIIDREVANKWDTELNIFAKKSFNIEAHEFTKTLKTIQQLAQEIRFLNCKTVVAIGGGVICDMIGFLASLYQKKFILIPTTLLAMADASVGGKTGVNVHGVGKNQLGCFAAPKKVLISNMWLRTLPDQQWSSGFTECIKHALINADNDLYLDLLRSAKNQMMDLELLLRVVAVKKTMVENDPFENGQRALLNLGHTMGHALEALASLSEMHLSSSLSTDSKPSALLHGHAISFGLLYEARLHELAGKKIFKTSSELKAKLRSVGCLLEKSEYENKISSPLHQIKTWEKILAFIYQDKKSSRSDHLSFTNWIRPQSPSGEGYIWEVSEKLAWQCWQETIHALAT